MLLMFLVFLLFFIKQKSSFVLLIRNLSSDVCSFYLPPPRPPALRAAGMAFKRGGRGGRPAASEVPDRWADPGRQTPSPGRGGRGRQDQEMALDRKSTRLNSSH